MEADLGDVDRRVGANLRAVRIAAALSLTTLAAMMGLSVDDLARSEAGERRLSAAELRSAMTSLDIAATRLFDGVRPAPPHPRPFLFVD